MNGIDLLGDILALAAVGILALVVVGRSREKYDPDSSSSCYREGIRTDTSPGNGEISPDGFRTQKAKKRP